MVREESKEEVTESTREEGGGRREVKTSLLIAQSQLAEARGRR